MSPVHDVVHPSVHPSSRRRSSIVGTGGVVGRARAARREPSSVRRRRERRAASIVNHARVHPSIGPSTPRARRAIARLACKNTTNQNKISTSRISDRSSSLASPPRRRRVTTARSISRSTRPPRPPRDRSFVRARDRSNVRANPVPRFQIHVHTDRSPVSTHRHTRRRTTRLTTTTSHDDETDDVTTVVVVAVRVARVHERTVTFTTSPSTNHPRSIHRHVLHRRCTPLSHTPSRVPPHCPHPRRPVVITRAVDARCRVDERRCWIPKPYTYCTHTSTRPALDVPGPWKRRRGWFSKDGFRDRDGRGLRRGACDRPLDRMVGREKTVRFDRAIGRRRGRLG